MVERDGTKFTCSCPTGAKKAWCKHSVLVAVRQKVVEYPPDAREVVIGQKPKRGRPKKAPTQRSQVARKRSEKPSTARARFLESDQSTSEDEPPAKTLRTRSRRS